MELEKKLQHFSLVQKVIAIIKDGGSNLDVCTNLIAPSLSNQFFDFPFIVPCLAHLLSTACSKAMKVDSLILQAKQSMSSCITYTKKV